MDSRDSAAVPPHLPHHLQTPPPSHPAVLLGQTQQHLPNNSYLLPNNNNSVNPTTTATTQTTITHHQNPGFPFNSMAAPKQLDHLQSDVSPSKGGGGGFSIEPARKKRGRPRKYSPDNSTGLGLSPAPATRIPSFIAQNDSLGGGGGTPSSETPTKKNRGRPSGSVKRQLDALGAPGVGFTPHVITVNAGEDIASKILAFSQQGPRTVCILSANGAVCDISLRQPAMTGGTVTYEGRFEIISLSGSFLLSDSNGNCSGTGGLSVLLAGSDGRVLGGGVAGMLKAASPVQVVVGSFIADGKKSKSVPSSSRPSHMLNFGAPGTGTGTNPSPGASSESDGENADSPVHHVSGPYANAGQPGQRMSVFSSIGWPNS